MRHKLKNQSHDWTNASMLKTEVQSIDNTSYLCCSKWQYTHQNICTVNSFLDCPLYVHIASYIHRPSGTLIFTEIVLQTAYVQKNVLDTKCVHFYFIHNTFLKLLFNPRTILPNIMTNLHTSSCKVSIISEMLTEMNSATTLS